MSIKSTKIAVDKVTVEGAMHAIRNLQSSLGIDLVDEEGYGYIYFALEKALEEASE
jgi:hypothetical protein